MCAAEGGNIVTTQNILTMYIEYVSSEKECIQKNGSGKNKRSSVNYGALPLTVSVPQKWEVDAQFEAWIRCEVTCVISQGWQGIHIVLKHMCICTGNSSNFINLKVSTFLEREGWDSHELVIILSVHDTDFTIEFNQGECSILWPGW